jgi:serine/threonine protein kinase
VQSLGWYEVENAICVAMEYCRHGDLQEYLWREGPLAGAEGQQVARQMLEGLHHMHQNGFAHRDLKLRVGAM